MSTSKNDQSADIPADVKNIVSGAQGTESMNGILRLLTQLGNCGLSAGAPPILTPVQSRG